MNSTHSTPPQRNLKFALFGLVIAVAIGVVIFVNRGSKTSETDALPAKKTTIAPTKNGERNEADSETKASGEPTESPSPTAPEVDLGAVTEKILAQGATDLNGALAALAAQPEAVRAATAPIILRMLAAQDPKRCADWVLANLGGGIESGLHPVFSQWVASDPTAAVDWLLAMDMKLTSALAPLLAKHLGGEAAVEFADQIMTFPASGERDALALLTLSNWAERSPQEAAAWALEQSPQLPVGVSAAVASWAQGDFASAEAWTRELPEGPNRDQAFQELSQAAFQKVPVDGMKMAMEIGNIVTRHRLITTLFSDWRKKDASAASQWLENDKTIDVLIESALRAAPAPLTDASNSGK